MVTNRSEPWTSATITAGMVAMIGPNVGMHSRAPAMTPRANAPGTPRSQVTIQVVVPMISPITTWPRT